MADLLHRDMTRSERDALEHEARVAREVRGGWSSTTLAIAVLLTGSFVLGLLLFGLPAQVLVGGDEDPSTEQAVLLLPAIATMAIAGGWSVCTYLRGSWRVDPRLLEDLDYGRVEVIRGEVREAWVVADPSGSTWLLELEDLVLAIGPPASRDVSPRTLPGRRIVLVRCKHSGLVLRWETSGTPLAPSGRLRHEEGALGIESARFEGSLGEVVETRLRLAA